MERDDNALCVIIDFHISTHTLTWSVTYSLVVFIYLYDISTHTLTWSVTAPLTSVLVSSPISTHTLTWSVTTVTLDAVLYL